MTHNKEKIYYLKQDLVLVLNTPKTRVYFRRMRRTAGAPHHGRPHLDSENIPPGEESSTKTGLSFQLLVNVEVLSYCVSVWYTSCTAQDRKDTARVVKTAQRMMGSPHIDLD